MPKKDKNQTTNPSSARGARLGPIGLVALTIIAVGTMFQNCGTYEPLNNPLYSTGAVSNCIGPSCVQDLNYLALYVGNPDPILITRDLERSIDIGGYCDTAGYPDSKLYVELKSGATSVIAPYASIAKCDSNGRFRVLVDLPATYNYNLAYSIVLTFRAVDSSGNEYDHPTGVNRREVAVLTAP
ncbi:hypothetical protein BH10BDE1_BH10BDE1_15040 [soil metagenome]